MSDLWRHTSGAYAPRDRLAILREALSFVKGVDIMPMDECPVDFDLTLHSVGDVLLVDTALSRMSVQRDRAQAANGADHMVLSFVEAGRVRYETANADLDLGPGDAYLRYNRASRHRIADGPRYIDVSVPRAVMRRFVPDLDRLAYRKIPDSAELRLLHGYVAMLARQGEAVAPSRANIISRHLLELMAMALDPEGEPAGRAWQGGSAVARLAAVKADIRRNAAEPWLTLDAMAQRHGISSQYLRALFYKDGTSFSDFVRERRLDMARGMLEAASPSPRRISDIAYACGFGDLSHFNHAFRRRFGMTPSEARGLGSTPAGVAKE